MQRILIVLLMMISLPGFAQRNKTGGEHENLFRFGAKGGVNINKITGQSYKEGFNFNLQGGGFIQINFSSRFGIKPEVNFVQSSSEFSNDPSDIYDDIFRDGSQKKSKLNYLEVPVLLNINLGSSKRVKLQVGPAYGGLVKSIQYRFRSPLLHF
ncbi:MAG: PorT family protein [Chitinophagaceae bacterium]|nr:PorT family protein [Chitinophagaceae bacterium]